MSVVVITGSNGGFGFHGARSFARNGDTVVATMRDMSKAEPLRAAARAEGLSIDVRALDVTKAETFSHFVDEVVADCGGIDVLVNNAGILRVGTAEDTAEQSLRAVMETNFLGPMLLTQAVLPHMRERGSGYLIMVSSLSGIAGLPGDFAYTASKFALEGATEAMRHEVDRWGICVAIVEAGMYATGILGSDQGAELPEYYPAASPYADLIRAKLSAVRARLEDAFDPAAVGELFVRIAASDGGRLRWPADPVAEKVLGVMFGQDDAERDRFLREVADCEWWSRGEGAPS